MHSLKWISKKIIIINGISKEVLLSILVHIAIFLMIAVSFKEIPKVNIPPKEKVMVVSLIDYKAPVIKKTSEIIKTDTAKKKQTTSNAVESEKQTKKIVQAENSIKIQKKIAPEKQKKTGSPKEVKPVEISEFDKAIMAIEKSIENSRAPLKESDVSDLIEEWNEEKDIKNIEYLANEIKAMDAYNLAVKKAKEESDKRIDEIEKRFSREQVEEKEEEIFIMDPLIAYQQDIAYTLQDQMRITSDMYGKSCVLTMHLLRDGYVLRTDIHSGDSDLCKEAIRATVRVNKMPMPKDKSLYPYLEKLKVTIYAINREHKK